MGNGDQAERRVDVGGMAKDIKYIVKAVDGLTDTVKEDRKAQVDVNTDFNTRVTRLEAHAGIYAAAQAAYTTIAAVLASLFGR